MPVIIPDHIVWQDVPGDLALFDSETGIYHALNGSAAAIWREIAAGADSETAVDRLSEKFGAPRAEIATDVAAFVADALAKGILMHQPA